jgi:hypothetical protein
MIDLVILSIRPACSWRMGSDRDITAFDDDRPHHTDNLRGKAKSRINVSV